MRNEELEKIKLELEIKELRRPWFARPANIISIFSLIFAMYQFQSAQSTKKEAEKVEKQAEVLAQQAEEKDEYLTTKNKFLVEKEQQILKADKVLNEKSSGSRNELLPTESAEQTGQIMDVWANGESQDLVNTVREYLIV